MDPGQLEHMARYQVGSVVEFNTVLWKVKARLWRKSKRCIVYDIVPVGEAMTMRYAQRVEKSRLK